MWNANSNIDFQIYFIIFHTATSKLEVGSENAEDQRREGKTIPRKYPVVSVAPNMAVIEADTNYGYIYYYCSCIYIYIYIYQNNNSVTLLRFSGPEFHYNI